MTLHIYAQDYENERSIIVGDRKSLEILVKSINKLLDHPNETIIRFDDYTSDREKYEVDILVTNDFVNFKLPYKDIV